jgi:hypothetical protein
LVYSRIGNGMGIHIKYLISYEILIFVIDEPIDRAHGTEMPPILFLISGKLNMA